MGGLGASIWKFPFKVTDHLEIPMPVGAHVLHVECQNGTPCMWAIVDINQPLVKQQFRIFGTGHPINENLGIYIGTFQQRAFVWHVFRAHDFVPAQDPLLETSQ